MIKYMYGSVIIMLCTLCCNYNKEVKEYYESGEIKSRAIADKAHIKWIGYYKNGQIESQGELLNGIRIGNWTYYYENKTLKAQGYYDDGLKKGPWHYNNKDSTYQIEWDIFYNRVLKINVPADWVKKEQLGDNIPLAGFSPDSSSDANFNIMIFNYDHRNLDSVINENIRKARSNLGYKIEVLSLKEVDINNIKGKEVMQHVLAEGKDLTVLQYNLVHADSLYLVSFFVNKNKYSVYENLVKEVVSSFTLNQLK
ncbi:MORN repeat variant [Chitinophaga sp. YR573]|nr:MORN repeat variant [Chitinophaga sp. YR573]